MYFIALVLTLRLYGKASSLRLADSFALSHDLREYLRLAAVPLAQEQFGVVLLQSDAQHALIRLRWAEHADTPIAATLLQTLTAQSPLCLCQRRYEITSIDLNNSPWTGVATWTDFQSATPGPLIRLRFSTPCVTAQPESGQEQGILPFPEPLPLFSSLSQRWHALHGPALPCEAEEAIRASRCVLSAYRFHTSSVSAPGRKLKGYLGWMEYECQRRDTAGVATLNALTRLAFFSGVGYGSHHGLGAALVTIAKGEER